MFLHAFPSEWCRRYQLPAESAGKANKVAGILPARCLTCVSHVNEENLAGIFPEHGNVCIVIIIYSFHKNLVYR